MNIKLRKSLLILLLVSGTVMVSPAQRRHSASDPSGDPGDQTSFSSANDSPVPLLDGMDILLLIASGYGVFKYFQVRKK